MTKKIILALLITLLACSSAWGRGIMIMGGGTPAETPPSGWSDNFNGLSDQIEDQAAWYPYTYSSAGGDRSTYWNCANNRLEDGNAATQGAQIFNLADYPPTSADYYVKAGIYSSVAAGQGWLGVIARGAYAAGNTLTGYVAYIYLPSDTIYLRRFVANVDSGLASQAVVDPGWGSEQTLKIIVSGVGATVNIKVDLNGVQQINYDDTGATRIVTTGLGGVFSSHGTTEILYHDNFVIEY